MPKEELVKSMMDVVSLLSSFVTPLTIHSRVQDFDYNDPKMSER
jgi:hypothetical protein